jgi:hypothetical protein
MVNQFAEFVVEDVLSKEFGQSDEGPFNNADALDDHRTFAVQLLEFLLGGTQEFFNVRRKL